MKASEAVSGLRQTVSNIRKNKDFADKNSEYMNKNLTLLEHGVELVAKLVTLYGDKMLPDDMSKVSEQPQQSSTPPVKRCSKCGASMLLKSRGADKKLFWGCSNYPVCKNSEDYVASQPTQVPNPLDPNVDLPY